MSEARDALIVALDGSIEQARDWAEACAGIAGWVKVGMTLFYAEGPAIVEELLARGLRVFVDLKLHDIPHQVEGAASVLGSFGVGMFTVHATGGSEMMRAAKRGSLAGAVRIGHEPPLMLAVTVLTSADVDTLAESGVDNDVSAQVRHLALLAKESGADGIVCSSQEAALVRDAVGDDLLIITPGVRPVNSAEDDQNRVLSPTEAIVAGSTHLVVGRPITGSDDPKKAAQRIHDEIADAIGSQ